MNDDLITVFTPTYNRGKNLIKLHQSLLAQNTSNFEWLIVDDGSTDETYKIVKGLQIDNKLDIKYYKKENGGKHTAINLGVQKANGKLFFIIDSDDFLTNNALDLINENWEKIKTKTNICGIVGLSKFTNNEIVGTKFPIDDEIISFEAIYFKNNVKGDKSVAFKTEVLKEYPFPLEEGVKLVFEAVVWHEMAKKYKVICINEVIQIKEYLTEGLTNSSCKKWFIKSMAFSFYMLVKNNTYPLNKYPLLYFKNFIYLISNSLLVNKSYFDKLNYIHKFFYIIFYPRAFIAYLRMKGKIVD